MRRNDDLWGATLKALPTPPKPKTKAVTPKGLVRQEDYERRQFQQAFKKPTR